MGNHEGLMFYRCSMCRSVVSLWDVREGGCARCGGTRFSPTRLSLLEKIVQIAKHPCVWKWKDMG